MKKKIKDLEINVDDYFKDYSLLHLDTGCYKYQSWSDTNGIPFIINFNLKDKSYKFSHHVGEGCFIVSKTHLNYTNLDNFKHYLKLYDRVLEQYYWKGNFKKDESK